MWAERDERVHSSSDERRENDILNLFVLQYARTAYLPFRQG